MDDIPWPEGAGAHCDHWYDNEACCWCDDQPSTNPETADETPCPENEGAHRG